MAVVTPKQNPDPSSISISISLRFLYIFLTTKHSAPHESVGSCRAQWRLLPDEVVRPLDGNRCSHVLPHFSVFHRNSRHLAPPASWLSPSIRRNDAVHE